MQSYEDVEDSQVYEFSVDLGQIEFSKIKKGSNLIKISDEIAVKLKYPTVGMYTSPEFFDLSDENAFDYIITNCVVEVYEKDEVYDCSQFSSKEIKEFIDSIPSTKYKGIEEFFSNIPKLKHEIKYTNSLGTERSIVFTTLDDFFIFV